MVLFIDILSYLLIIVFIIYVRQILYFYRGLSRLTDGNNPVLHSVTVIIPARNEEENIEQCLNSLIAQNYPRDKLSIIVVDDQSSDRTPNIVARIAKHSPFAIAQFQSIDSSTICSPKIRAIMMGIQHSLSEIIILTDADCIAPTEWVATINSYFETSVGVVTGLTTYAADDRISRGFQGIQFLDFISYTAIAAGAIGMNRVLVSNGSNMAFRIQAFDESGGFETITHLNTGDDSLLAQKIVASGKWKARFAFREISAIKTKPVRSWKEVLHQRMRWVGQTAYYPADMMFFMISTFIMFIVLAAAIPLSFFAWNPLPWLILTGIFSIDYLMMHRFTTITQTHSAMKYFAATALIHIPLVLISTIGGYFFRFSWKERRLRKES